MDLELSDAVAALRANMRTMLAGICPPSVVRAVREGPRGVGSVAPSFTEVGRPS